MITTTKITFSFNKFNLQTIMKRISFSMILLMAGAVSFAQVKTVKEARSIASETNPDFAKAQQLINEALVNPETKDDAATWDAAGFIQKRINEKEMENQYLRKPYDTLQVYASSLNMFNYYFKCDELAQLPDAKGKVKNKYRKPNSATLLIERPNLINGGITYFNQDENKKALDFFAMYLEGASNPIFEGHNLVQTDTLMAQVGYFATLAAVKAEDYPSVLKYYKYAEDDAEYGKYVIEFASLAYKAQADTAQWINTLKEGFNKYPDHNYFFGNLVDYYSNTNKFEEAMQFADGMIAMDPENTFYLYVKAYLYHNMKDYDNAIEYYKKTIAADPNYAEAYSNLGLIYCQKAQDFSDNATTDMNSAQYAQEQEEIKKFYQEAKPYYEKTRELKPEQQDLWAQGLYRVYYNLNMGTEFEEIEKILGF